MKCQSLFHGVLFAILLSMISGGVLYKCFADSYLEGIVLSNHGNMPLDSVRVTSLLSSSTVLTGEDGQFQLLHGSRTRSQPDTIQIESFEKYRIHVDHPQQHITMLTPIDDPADATIYDLKGRAVMHCALGRTSRLSIGRAMGAGVYLLATSGSTPQRFLLTGHQSDGSVTRKQYTILHIESPSYSPVTDTVYFYKDGYTEVAVASEALDDGFIVRMPEKKWIASDIHNHTVLTDGAFIQDSVCAHAFGTGGLKVLVNSEHGGSFNRDTLGLNIVDDSIQGRIAPRTYEEGLYIPRWYTLEEYSWPKLLGQRTLYPDKILLQGLEWDCPGHEHSSVGFINDAIQPQAISEFEYRFDFNDTDSSRPWLTKNNAYMHENALVALKWLKNRYPTTSWFFINHPSREATGPYYVNHFRDFHNIAPEVFLGFEGMPGHHKNSVRGSYGYGGTNKNRTWGGADYILAEVGGMWDALLGEGRRIWTIVNSDFHSDGPDFWPGEYAKTWTCVTDTGAQAWLEGMRSGEMFIVHGDLISELDFSIDDGVRRVAMGSDMRTEAAELRLTIRFKSPVINNHGDSVKVNHIDLISGAIIGRIDPSRQNAYANPVNSSTTVMRRFTDNNWAVEKGYRVIHTTIPFTQPSYFRLRGTNLAVGTPDEVDEQGNPLMDIAGLNNEQVAWKDLWFYSNPIFVYRR